MTFSSGEVLTAANLNDLEVTTLGVGAASPVTPLEIASDDDLTSFTGTGRGALTITNTDYASGDHQAIDFRYAAGQPPSVRISAEMTSGGSLLHFGTSNSYASGVTNDALVIDPLGRIECGDSIPFGGTLGYLNVKGSGISRGIQMYNPTTTASVVAFLSQSDIGGTQVIRFIVRADGDVENANNSYGGFSDERLKTIEPARDYLADLQKLEVKNYKFTSRFIPTQVTVTDDEGNETTEEHPTEGAFVERDETDYSPKQLGLIAQQVEEHIPGLVKEDDYGVKSLRYSVLVPMLLQAVQTLTARIEALEA